ncbi:MAG: hypothetical protein N4A46_07585 [Schleiferiaceae bacterium]|jgi:uncharacterized membrane protein|nr:hypothetical protein [Schleiferiaceae bacterium]
MKVSLSLKYGVYIFLGLVSFFFSMHLLGLDHLTELRLFNFFIVSVGIYKLIEKNIIANKTNNYADNFLQSIKAAFTSILLFTVSLIIYLEFINPSFMTVLEQSKIWGINMGVMQIAAAILVEGVASSFMICFTLMQYFKSIEYSEGSLI